MNSIYKYLNKIENDCPGAIKGIAAALIKAQYGGDWKVILPAFFSDLKNELEKINSEKKEMIENEIKIVQTARDRFPNVENDLVAVDNLAAALFFDLMSCNDSEKIQTLDKEFDAAKSLYLKMRSNAIVEVPA